MLTIEIIKTFVAIQRALLKVLQANLNGQLDELNLRDTVPKYIKLEELTWEAHPHGVGIRFRCDKDSTVVDAHVGIVDGEDIFDAWRLCQYLESIEGGDYSEESISNQLEEFYESGKLERAEDYPYHFRLLNNEPP